VNWGDVQKREENIYPDPVAFPAILGMEVAGIVGGRR
jgi:NADPH:quinone reductase-like Zn-dependent oxidoreductase